MDRRLSQFLAVAEAGNVSTAAELLNVSQPTVSVNIRRLEEAYSVQLFTRSSRGVQLTEFGKVLYEHVKVMAQLDEHAAAEIRILKASRQKAMRVGTGFAWWSLFMRDIVTTYRDHHAGVSLHVYMCSSLDGLRSLLSGDTACFVGTKVAKLNDNMGLVFEHLFSVEDVVFARSDHPLSGREIRLSDLRAYPRMDVAPFVNKHLGIIEHANFDPSLAALGQSQSGLFSTNSMTAGLDMLCDTDAFLVYPVACRPYFAEHGITMLDVSDRSREKIKIGIYRHADRKPDAHLHGILESIRSAAKVIPPGTLETG
ncbi:LysR family transcriptional regulator [uncultured Tateyamaria sp.]|uniref:LysR family transcriptional regulator n=1 Tax=uncultured Tateyamaria sp. TaxID=455651 RepID=UPI0026367FBE|nr:LysR family transcriptional regulator [uncultured Tateyamaria sp.]